MSKTITLTRGLEVIVDDADYVRLVGFKWTALSCGTSDHHIYAARWVSTPSGPQRQRTVLMHRMLLGEPDGMVRHVNGNGLDNRRENLLVVPYKAKEDADV